MQKDIIYYPLMQEKRATWGTKTTLRKVKGIMGFYTDGQ